MNVNKFKDQHGLVRWRVQCVVIICGEDISSQQSFFRKGIHRNRKNSSRWSCLREITKLNKLKDLFYSEQREGGKEFHQSQEGISLKQKRYA